MRPSDLSGALILAIGLGLPARAGLPGQDINAPEPLTLPAPVRPLPNPSADATALPPGHAISLETALATAVAANPDLVALRLNAPATAEAVAVARRFPVALNPILWVNPRPWVYARDPGPGLDQKDIFLNMSLRQPIELGHQTRYREAIARASYDQTRWTIVQAEVLALVQTYRFFQTAAYRRERLRLAGQLAAFNDRLVEALRKGLEAGLVSAADVSLAEVERAALGQQVEAARQDYENALADLRNQIGIPETAGTAEPVGVFSLPANIPPADEQGLIALALESRPEVHAARAQARGALAAVGLARGDCIPTVTAGPEYQTNENGTQFFGFVFIAPLPVLNNGTPLVRQREAEYRRAVVAVQQLERRTVAQVRAAVARWDGAHRLLVRTDGLSGTLQAEVSRVERLFQENQTDLTRLLQARQRLIQLENARLDALWQATQAQADLLTALGAPTLLAAVREATDGSAGPGTP